MITNRSPDPFGIATGQAETLQYDQPEADNRQVSDIMALLDRALHTRSNRDVEWSLYLSFLLGDQHLRVDANTQALVRIIDSGKKRLWSINNQLSAIVRAFIGKITSGRPSFYCRPGTGGEDQVQGSRVADRFIEFFSEKENLGSHFDNAIATIPWAGLGIMHLYWDPLGGRCLGHCATCGYTHEDLDADLPCPNCQQGKINKVYEGDVKVTSCDPRDVHLQPGVDDSNVIQWAVRKRPLPVSLVRQMFPQHALHIQPDSNIYPANGARYTYNLTAGSWEDEELIDHVMLYEYHEKPTGLYPKGRVVFIANKILLEQRESFYHLIGRLPFFFFKWEPVPGQFYPQPPIANAWHLQKELNEIYTQIREYIELIARTKLINVFGSRVAQDEISAVTGQILLAHPQFSDKIRYLNPPSMPPEVFMRAQQLIADMRSMFGVTAQESNMPMDPNGRAMAIVENESDRSLGHVIRALYKELSEVLRCAVIVAKNYYAPDRKFAIMGDDLLEVYSFQDLNFHPGMSIAIEAEDGFSRNQAIRLQEVGNLMSLGFFVDPMTGMPNQAIVAKAARLKIPGLTRNSQDSEVQAAQAAIKQLEAGIPYQPQPEDDAQTFLETTQNWLRTQGRRKKVTQPKTYQAVQMLYQWYMQVIFMQQQQAMMQQAQAGGMVPGGGQSVPSADQSPGGTPNQTQEEGTAQSGVVNGANQMVAQADQQAQAAVPQALA